MKADELKVKIMTPGEVLYNGPALAVSSANSQGKFDIIPQHANYITIVENQPVTLTKLDHTKQSFNFSQAIIYHYNNQITIYADPKSANLSMSGQARS